MEPDFLSSLSRETCVPVGTIIIIINASVAILAPATERGMRGPQGLPAFCINAGLGNSLKASFRIDAGLGNAGKLAEAAATRPAAEAAEAETGSPAAAAATASQAAAETGSPAAVAATASQAAGSTFATTSAAATASAAARLERGLPPGGVPPGEVSGATWAVAPIRAGGQGRKRYATGCDGAVA
eukprot:16450109-Heterocapsa_arctica.AAC.1